MKFSLDGVGPVGHSWIERDVASLSPSYSREYALVVDHAQGSEVWDVDGRRYIDFMAGVAVLNVGHRHPAVQAAVAEQLDKFWHICLSDFFYPQAVTLAEKIQSIAPMDAPTQVYFGNSGTEAVEAAIKLAMYTTGRTRFIGFMGAFHGRTLGSLSFTASKAVQRANYLSGVKVYHVPYPNAWPARPTTATARSSSITSRSSFSATSSRPTTWPASSSSRSRARAATSCPRRASSRACARSATGTASC